MHNESLTYYARPRERGLLFFTSPLVGESLPSGYDPRVGARSAPGGGCFFWRAPNAAHLRQGHRKAGVG